MKPRLAERDDYYVPQMAKEEMTVMRNLAQNALMILVAGATLAMAAGTCRAEVKASEGTLTIPTYPWEEDVNPKFWALESGPKLSTTLHWPSASRPEM